MKKFISVLDVPMMVCKEPDDATEYILLNWKNGVELKTPRTSPEDKL